MLNQKFFRIIFDCHMNDHQSASITKIHPRFDVRYPITLIGLTCRIAIQNYGFFEFPLSYLLEHPRVHIMDGTHLIFNKYT